VKVRPTFEGRATVVHLRQFLHAQPHARIAACDFAAERQRVLGCGIPGSASMLEHVEAQSAKAPSGHPTAAAAAHAAAHGLEAGAGVGTGTGTEESVASGGGVTFDGVQPGIAMKADRHARKARVFMCCS
jgi:hypothetical protein